MPHDGDLATRLGQGKELDGRADRGSELFHDFAAQGRFKVGIVGFNAATDRRVIGQAAWPSSAQEHQLIVFQQDRANVVTDPHVRDDSAPSL